MAIAALTARGETNRAHVVAIAVRFALGHALVLTLCASVVIVLGWSIPELVERGGEILGGLLLIGLGGGALWATASGRVYAHAHPHDPDPGAWHLHWWRGPAHHHHDSHSALPSIMGAVFAISSLRALSTLTPFGGSLGVSLPLLLLLIALFAVGILMSMSLFGVALARTLSTRVVARLGRGAAMLMAVASIGLGAYWILSAGLLGLAIS